MREYKFRGKRIDNREWVYGDLLQGCEICDVCEISDCTSADGTRYEIEKETVGQYTGLHDKNGKEIYEGDIIQYEDIYNGFVEYSEKYAQFILKETGVVADECEALGEFNIKAFEIIGNVYKNKDLLEG